MMRVCVLGTLFLFLGERTYWASSSRTHIFCNLNLLLLLHVLLQVFVVFFRGRHDIVVGRLPGCLDCLSFQRDACLLFRGDCATDEEEREHSSAAPVPSVGVG